VTRTCPVCDRPLERRWTPAEAEVARVRVVADRVPRMVCPEGHEEGRPDVGYIEAVTEQAREQVVPARRPVLPWRPQRCHACGADLTMPGFRSERPVTVSAEGLEVHTLRLDVPLLRCTECAVENLPREAWDDAAAALAAALSPG
jgi:hypothetical protein